MAAVNKLPHRQDSLLTQHGLLNLPFQASKRIRMMANSCAIFIIEDDKSVRDSLGLLLGLKGSRLFYLQVQKAFWPRSVKRARSNPICVISKTC